MTVDGLTELLVDRGGLAGSRARYLAEIILDVTPEMMVAGAAELYQDDWVESREQWAARIYSAMVRVK